MENASLSVRTLPPEERYDAFGIEEVSSKWFPEGFINVLEDQEIYGYLRNKYAEVKYIEMLGLPRKFDEVQAPFNSLFVLPRLAAEPIDAARDESEWAEKLIPLVRAIKANKRLVILGDPGSGKTTIVSWLVNQLTVTGNSIPKEHLGWLVPIAVTLRKFDLPDANDGQTWLDEMVRHATGELLSPWMSYELAKRGQLFVLLDGIDEMSLKRREQLQLGVRRLLDAYPKLRLLATSRPLGYRQAPLEAWKTLNPTDKRTPDDIKIDAIPREPDWNEIERLRLRRRKPLDLLFGDEVEFDEVFAGKRELPTLYVAPFQAEQISNLIQRWYASREPNSKTAQDRSTELLEAIRQEQSLNTLARTPRLLTMMALIHRTYARLPHGRAELYQDFADCYLDTLIVQKGLNSPFTPLEKREVLNRLGWEMHKAMTGKASHLSFPPTRTGVESLVAEVLRAAGSSESESNAQTLVDHVSQSSGLFIPSGTEHGEEVFAFAHLSFQEFFAASRINSALAEQGWGDQEDVLLTVEGVVKLADDPQWGQAFIFLFEMVRPKVGDGLAERILANRDWRSAAAMIAQLQIDVHAQFSPDFRRKAVGKLLDPQRRNFDSLLAILMKGDEIRETVSENLVQLISLTNLDMSGTGINEVGPLATLKSLQSLSLAGTGVTDIKPLTSLKTLQNLNLNGTRVTDITPLAALKSLKSLDLMYTGVTDITPFSALISLQRVDLDGTGVSDIEPLAALKSLQILDLRHTEVTDIEPLSALISLNTLYLIGTGVTDVAPLAALKSLRSLNLHTTRVTDVAPLAALKSLQSLDLRNTGVTDITPLAPLISLKSLVLRDTGVTDITPLAALKSLQRLDLRDTGVTDITPLAALKSLQSLDLMNTGVTDITPLAALKSLQRLDLRNTGVTDITPLAGLKNLKIHR